MTGVSIVIPTLNEADYIAQTLRCLSVLTPPAREVLIVDGGSTDDTMAIAQHLSRSYSEMEVKLIGCGSCGRSVQMNKGASQAIGDHLCFLHADTLVPPDLIALIEHHLADPQTAGGGFISLMAGAHTTRWGISCHNYLKTYYAPLLFRPHLFVKGLRLLFGDQVMFCRRSQFWTCGGFDPALPIMEEADLCRKLVWFGRLRQVNRVVQSSDRRVAYWGNLKATFIYTSIGLLWGLGVSAKTLKQFYDEIR